MGLAAPRNKRKIAADPRNLTWSSNAASTSVGHKLMTAQGWSEGQSLGSQRTSHLSGGTLKDENAARLAAARVGVIFKDDTLGLGAKLRSKDVEAQKTGMDAFVGLLGRLNADGEEEEREVERKESQRRLQGYVSGRWGGMVFVPGGVLVGGEEFGTKKEAREKAAKEDASVVDEETEAAAEGEGERAEPKEERAKRKEEKRRRKEERRARREAKAAKKSQSSSKATSDVDDEEDEETSRSSSRSRSKSKSKKKRSKPAPDEPISSASEAEQQQEEQENASDAAAGTSKKSTKKRKHLDETSTSASTPTVQSASASPAPSPRPAIRTGRQLLRGRNIEAKRRAFQDAKGLDGIFMRAGA